MFLWLVNEKKRQTIKDQGEGATDEWGVDEIHAEPRDETVGNVEGERQQKSNTETDRHNHLFHAFPSLSSLKTKKKLSRMDQYSHSGRRL